MKSIVGNGFLKSVFRVFYTNLTESKNINKTMEANPFQKMKSHWKAVSSLLKDFERDVTVPYVEQISYLLQQNTNTCRVHTKQFIEFLQTPSVRNILLNLADKNIEEIQEDLEPVFGELGTPVVGDVAVAKFFENLIQLSVFGESSFKTEVETANITRDTPKPDPLQLFKKLLWMLKNPKKIEILRGSKVTKALPDLNLASLQLLCKCLKRSVSSNISALNQNISFTFPYSPISSYGRNQNFLFQKDNQKSRKNLSLSDVWVNDQEKLKHTLIQNLVGDIEDIAAKKKNWSEMLPFEITTSDQQVYHGHLDLALNTVHARSEAADQLLQYFGAFRSTFIDETIDPVSDTACNPWLQVFYKLLRKLEQSEKLHVVFELFLDELIEHDDMWIFRNEFETFLLRDFGQFYTDQISMFMDAKKLSAFRSNHTNIKIAINKERLEKNLKTVFGLMNEKTTLKTDLAFSETFDLSQFDRELLNNKSTTFTNLKVLQFLMDIFEFEMFETNSLRSVTRFFAANPIELLHHFEVDESNSQNPDNLPTFKFTESFHCTKESNKESDGSEKAGKNKELLDDNTIGKIDRAENPSNYRRFDEVENSSNDFHDLQKHDIRPGLLENRSDVEKSLENEKPFVDQLKMKVSEEGENRLDHQREIRGNDNPAVNRDRTEVSVKDETKSKKDHLDVQKPEKGEETSFDFQRTGQKAYNNEKSVNDNLKVEKPEKDKTAFDDLRSDEKADKVEKSVSQRLQVEKPEKNETFFDDHHIHEKADKNDNLVNDHLRTDTPDQGKSKVNFD